MNYTLPYPTYTGWPVQWNYCPCCGKPAGNLAKQPNTIGPTVGSPYVGSVAGTPSNPMQGQNDLNKTFNQAMQLKDPLPEPKVTYDPGTYSNGGTVNG